jgi:hypothetical protein
VKPKSWKTTAWGVASIALTIFSAIMHFHQTGQLDLPTIISGITTAAAGAGLINAADHSNLAK